jgi:hypothetical protein
VHERPIQALLHIGDMKCGSTSIQEWMAQDADILRANGYWRSDATRVVNYDSRLASYALDDRRLDTNPRKESCIFSAHEVPAHRLDIERRLTAEVAALPQDARGMIFSHELLLSLQEREVQRLVTMLRRLFAGIRVVAYIRRQDRLFLSLWGQRLKSRDPGPEFFSRLISNYHYLRMLGVWERAVGRENLVVRVFDKTAFAQGDLQADFRDAAAIPPDDRYAPPTRTNESLDAAAQSLLLELCDRITSRQERTVACRVRRILRPWQPRKVKPIDLPASLANFLMQHRTGRPLLPGRAWAEHVMTAFREENEEIRRRYFPDRPALFDDRFEEYPEETGSPGMVYRPCDPEAFRHPLLGPPDSEAVAEAYRLVLWKVPRAADIAHAQRIATNIAHLYAWLLSRSRATRGTTGLPLWTSSMRLIPSVCPAG